MRTFEDDLLADAENDRQTVEFIKNYLPQEVKEKFTDEDLYYFLDVIGEYYCDLLDKAGNNEDIDIDIDAVFLQSQASGQGIVENVLVGIIAAHIGD